MTIVKNHYLNSIFGYIAVYAIVDVLLSWYDLILAKCGTIRI